MFTLGLKVISGYIPIGSWVLVCALLSVGAPMGFCVLTCMYLWCTSPRSGASVIPVKRSHGAAWVQAQCPCLLEISSNSLKHEYRQTPSSLTWNPDFPKIACSKLRTKQMRHPISSQSHKWHKRQQAAASTHMLGWYHNRRIGVQFVDM